MFLFCLPPPPFLAPPLLYLLLTPSGPVHSPSAPSAPAARHTHATMVCLSGGIQGQECTRCLGTCGAPTYLQGVAQGEWIPAECLGRNVIACKLGYVHRGTLPGQK